MTRRRREGRRVLDPSKWERVGPGAYRTLCGRGRVARVGPKDWAAHVGPDGRGRRVGNGSTAVDAAGFVERALLELYGGE